MKGLKDIKIIALFALAIYIMFTIDANPIETLPQRGYAYHYSGDWHTLRLGDGSVNDRVIEWRKEKRMDIPLYALWFDLIHDRQTNAMIVRVCYKEQAGVLRKCIRLDWE